MNPARRSLRCPILCWVSLFLGLLVSASSVVAQTVPAKATKYKSVSKTSQNLRVHFIDVGPGDAILIETPGKSGKHIVLDGGKLGSATNLMPYLTYFVSAAPVDLAIVTHPDYDHYLGMEYVFRKFPVREYWDTGYSSTALPGSWHEFQGVVDEEPDCAVYTPISAHHQPGESYDLGDGVSLIFLNVDGNPPFKDPESLRHFSESERRNNASLALMLRYGKVSFLLAGDINGRNKDHFGASTDNECDSVERLLVERAATNTACSLKATVLKAPHHGSNGASSGPFLQAVAPEWVVISAGHELGFNHPVPETLARYQRAGIPADHLLRTDAGDETPEVSKSKATTGNDCYVFETDGQTITAIRRLKVL